MNGQLTRLHTVYRCPDGHIMHTLGKLIVPHVMPLLLGALVVLTPLIGQALNGPWLTASLQYVTLRVQVTSNYAGAPKLIEEFSSNDPINHSVFCLSSFFDVKYQLRNASNELITPDSKPWEHATDVI